MRFGIITMLLGAYRPEHLSQLMQVCPKLYNALPKSRLSKEPADILPVGGGSNCPSSGIRYIPKRSAPPSKPRPSTTQQPGQPEPTGPVEPRRGNLRVYTGDQQQRGCLISHGTWFTSGTCATFKATDVTGMLIFLSFLSNAHAK